MNKNDLYRTTIIANSTNANNLVNKKINGYKTINAVSDTCAESYKIYIDIKNNKIIDAKFSGFGCLISKAALNIVSNMITTKEVKDACNLIINYKKMIHKKVFNQDQVGDLIVFENVSMHLNRVSCALLGADKILKLISSLGKD